MTSLPVMMARDALLCRNIGCSVVQQSIDTILTGMISSVASMTNRVIVGASFASGRSPAHSLIGEAAGQWRVRPSGRRQRRLLADFSERKLSSRKK